MSNTTRVVRFSSKLLCANILRMRFDKTSRKPLLKEDNWNAYSSAVRKQEDQAGPDASSSGSRLSSSTFPSSSPSSPTPAADRLSMRRWITDTVESLSHPSMKPKPVNPAFTPYPLPKYDASMGFGPVFLKNIPDVYHTQQRMAEAQQKTWKGQKVPRITNEEKDDDAGKGDRIKEKGGDPAERWNTPSCHPPQEEGYSGHLSGEGSSSFPSYFSSSPSNAPSELPIAQLHSCASSPARGEEATQGTGEAVSSQVFEHSLLVYHQQGQRGRKGVSSMMMVPEEGLSSSSLPTVMREEQQVGMDRDTVPTSAMITEREPALSFPFSVDVSTSPSYVVKGDSHLRVLDRLVCHRPLEDLLQQFHTRPQREARTATLLDLASTLSLRTTEELVRLFSEITCIFSTSSGNTQAGGGAGVGLQFLVTKVVKFGRPYYVTDELMKAYLELLSSATEYFVNTAPHHLWSSPAPTASSASSEGSPSAALCVQLLQFMALIRVFQPNLWFSPNPNAPSNRADYQHPRGINRFTAYRRDGEVLFDFLQHLVLESATLSAPPSPCTKERGGGGTHGPPHHNEVPLSFSFLNQFSLRGLLELLKGFAAVSPDGVPSGEVADIIWKAIVQRLEHGGGVLFGAVSSTSSSLMLHSESSSDPSLTPSALASFMEELYFTLTIIGWTEDKRRNALLEWLLATPSQGTILSAMHTSSEAGAHMMGASCSSPHRKGNASEMGGMANRDEATERNKEKEPCQCFGPNFFAAASQEVSELLKQKIVEGPLQQTLQFYQSWNTAQQESEKGTAEGKGEKKRIPVSTISLSFSMGKVEGSPFYAVIDSSRELLMSLESKALAVAFARAHEYDRRCLELLSPCEESFLVIADRVALEAKDREGRIPSIACLSYPLSSSSQKKGGSSSSSSPSTMPVPLRSIATQLASGRYPCRSFYLTRYKGQRVHPIRTFLSDLGYINALHSIFVLHSSSVTTSVDSLRSALQRVRSGKEAVVCTMSFLCALANKIYYHHGGSLTGRGKEKTGTLEETAARRALSMIAQEMKKGRVVLLPFTEELLLHDAGVVCEENLMLWTIAAFMAREMPHVKVHTLQHAFSAARQPHHALKGPHSPLRSLSDPLYDRSTPLLASLGSKRLRSVTHHVRLQQKVRDSPPRLHKVHPTRARFLYRRDLGLYDKIRVTARHVAPGFAQGALDSDLRGLGFYTPDHPQPDYVPLASSSIHN